MLASLACSTMDMFCCHPVWYFTNVFPVWDFAFSSSFISLRDNPLGESVGLIAQAIMAKPGACVTQLDLSDNLVGDSGAVMLVRLLAGFCDQSVQVECVS